MLRSLYLLRHSRLSAVDNVPRLSRAERAADIVRHLILPHRRQDRRIDRGGLVLRGPASRASTRPRRSRRSGWRRSFRQTSAPSRAPARTSTSVPGWRLPEAAMPEPALERRAEVRDDVAEEVVGDDHLELARVEHHVHRERVDVVVRWRRCPGTRRELAGRRAARARGRRSSRCSCRPCTPWSGRAPARTRRRAG